MFFGEKYSKYDENGIPTHDEKAKELSESIRNKLKKEWNKQDGIYQTWLKSQSEANNGMAEEAKTE